MTEISAKRQDTDTEQAIDGYGGPLVMNSYGYLKVDQINELKESIDELKADIAEIKTILNDVWNSTNHSLKVSVL